MVALQIILDRLESVHASGDQYLARCPAHDDHTPSLSLCQGEDGRILVHCFAGCATADVLARINLTTADLMPARVNFRTDSIASTAGATAVMSGASRTALAFATLDAAAEAMVERHGPPAQQWQYRDNMGAVVGAVLRWNHGDKKTYRPISKHAGEWRLKGMPTPRPLYNLPTLLTTDRSNVIWIHEGEKSADAGSALGVVSTTSAHGAESAAKTDWSPLAGRDVIIVRDNDAAGATYATTVMRCLSQLDPPARVRLLDLPDLPEHGDIVDYIEAQRRDGRTDQEIRRQLEGLASTAERIEPTSRQPAVLPWKPFPLEVLPTVIREFVSAHARAMRCDPTFIALPLLAMLAACVGMTRRAKAKNAWQEPCVLWTAIVTPSGTLKTPTMRAALYHLRRAQQRELDIHASNLLTYEEDCQQHDKAMVQWRKDTAGSPAPEKPKPPAAIRYLVSDATVEALAPILQDNPRGLLMERDELAGWIGDLDRYARSSGGDVARWLSAWSGEQLIIDRKSGGTIFVPHAAISVTGTIQPEVLSRVLGRSLRENGLAARLLMAMPPRRPATWSDDDVDPRVQLALGDVVDRLLSLEFEKDGEDRLSSIDVPLKPSAKDEFVKWYNCHEQELAEETGDLAAAMSKMRGYALRLALLIQATRWASNEAGLDGIDETSLRAALTLAGWFKYETRRVYATLDLSPEDAALRHHAELIERKGGSVTVREWQRARSHKTSMDAVAELQTLAAAGFGTLAPAAQSGPGQPSMVFRLGCTDTGNTLAGEPESPILSVSVDSHIESQGEEAQDWGEM